MAEAGTRAAAAVESEAAVDVRRGEDDQDGLWLGDAIHFFLSAKRAGGRSEKTVADYRKKLERFQRLLALWLGGEDSVDAPYII